jgi:hypothetical protein
MQLQLYEPAIYAVWPMRRHEPPITRVSQIIGATQLPGGPPPRSSEPRSRRRRTPRRCNDRPAAAMIGTFAEFRGSGTIWHPFWPAHELAGGRRTSTVTDPSAPNAALVR